MGVTGVMNALKIAKVALPCFLSFLAVSLFWLSGSHIPWRRQSLQKSGSLNSSMKQFSHPTPPHPNRKHLSGTFTKEIIIFLDPQTIEFWKHLLLSVIELTNKGPSEKKGQTDTSMIVGWCQNVCEVREFSWRKWWSICYYHWYSNSEILLYSHIGLYCPNRFTGIRDLTRHQCLLHDTENEGIKRLRCSRGRSGT